MSIQAVTARAESSQYGITRRCWRCGVDFDSTLYIVDAPCIDCQEFLHEVDGDTTHWVRRTQLRHIEDLRGGTRIVYSDPRLSRRSAEELEELRHRALELHHHGLEAFIIAWRLDTSDTWVRRLLRKQGLTPNKRAWDELRDPSDVRVAHRLAA